MNGMTLIVKTITRLVLGFILVFGISTVLYGHITPGGGFAGGVMLACGFILLVLAFGKKEAINSAGEKTLTNWDSFAVLSLIEVILIGLFGEVFFKHYITEGTPLRLLSGGSIIISNINVGIKVGVFLFAIFMALAVFRMAKER